MHKDGHAILCALTIALTDDEKDVYDGTDSYILQCKTLNLGKSIGTNRTIMHNNKKNEELQSRREFFKKAAKGALPIIAGAILASNPAVSAANVMSCAGCNNRCMNSCFNTCYKSCSGKCSGASNRG